MVYFGIMCGAVNFTNIRSQYELIFRPKCRSSFQVHQFFFLLQFQSQNVDNWLVFVSVIFNLVWTLALVFVPCEIGERVRSEFMTLNFTISQFDWHLFPDEIQKILPVIIINAQQPVLIEWFGSISCVREVFKKVCRFYSFTIFNFTFHSVHLICHILYVYI